MCVGDPGVGSRGVRAASGHMGRLWALRGGRGGGAQIRERGGWASSRPPRSSCAPGSRPSVAPARRRTSEAPAPGARLQPPPPESSDCPHRRPGTPWAGPTPGSPPTASQSWAGKGILARCCLRAGRQVSAGTGRDTGRDPCPAPTRGPGAPRRMSARAPPGGAGPRESCTAAPLPGPSRVPSCGSQFVPL